MLLNKYEGEATSPQDRSTRVVLIDDHHVVLEGLVRSLKRAGFTVLGAFVDPTRACELIENEAEVDLVVIDLRLGEESGVDVIRSLHRRHPDVRIAVFTSFEDRNGAAAAIRAGARGFLLKDVRSSELADSLCKIAQGALVVDSRLASAVLATEMSTLTSQEIAILELVASGLTNRQIGVKLHLSPYTVKDYLARVMRRMGTSTRAETVARAVQERLITLRQ